MSSDIAIGRPVSATTRRRFLLTCGAGILGAGLPGLNMLRAVSRESKGILSSDLKLFRRTSRALGSEVSILVLHEDPAVAGRALDAAFAELNLIEHVMSIYLPGSQVSRLNAEGFIKKPDPRLVSILDRSRDISERSAGAFDITVQPLWSLYFSAQREGRLPASAEIDAARAHVDWREVSVAPEEIRLRSRGMSITLNGIAQGFAADRVMDALKQNGIQHALVNTGEIASLGRKSGDKPWSAGIQHPRRKDAYLGLAQLDGLCMSTSGDYETTFSPDFSANHIFDPATGRSPLELSSVTIMAAGATEADALSTAIFVLGTDRGLALVQQTRNAEALFVTKDQRIKATPSFPWYKATGEASVNPEG